MSDAIIWVLGDNRIGNTNQAIALADNLDMSFEVKNIRYNILGCLPNFALMMYPLHIDKNILKRLKDSSPPKLIISAGRRTAALAIYLKKIFSDVLLVQIMNPESNIDKFDLVILPEHDNFTKYNENVVKITGAFSNIHTKIDNKLSELPKYYPEVKKFIAVIIGGDNKDAKFTNQNALNLVNILQKIANNHTISLFFSFSRRTPKFLKQLVKNNFLWPHIIYDPSEGGYNPYFDMLKNADYIICTGDSISMCSEVASSGKPFYIYGPFNTELKKHKFFVQQLVDLGIARRLEENNYHLKEYTYTPLNEVGKIARLIKHNFLT